jgi:hypothetical protein
VTKTAAVCLGSLYDDLTAVASKVYGELVHGERTVWADDEAKVYAIHPDAAKDLPASWIAGTFSMGHPIGEVEDDLRALLRERARSWIVD